MSTRLVEVLINERERALDPLLRGQPVVLKVNDPKMRSKKRVSQPILMIAPVSAYGINEARLLVSIPGYGSEVINPWSFKATQLYRVGLSMSAAKVLKAAIEKLFKRQPRR